MKEVLSMIIKFLAMPILVTSGLASIIFLVVGFVTMDVPMSLISVFFLTMIYELICKIIIERAIK